MCLACRSFDLLLVVVARERKQKPCVFVSLKAGGPMGLQAGRWACEHRVREKNPEAVSRLLVARAMLFFGGAGS